MKAAKLKSKTCEHSERFKQRNIHNHTNNMCKAWSAGFPNVPWRGWWSWLIEPHNYNWVGSEKHLILAVFVVFSIITVEKIEAVRAELASWPKQHILKCLIVRKIFATSNRIKVTVAVISCHKKFIVIHDSIFAYKLYRVNADAIQHLQCIMLCQWKPNWNKKVYIFSQKTVFWTKVSGFL